MAIKLHFNLAESLGTYVATTLTDLKGYAWLISEEYFGNACVQIEVDKVTVAKFRELLTQVNGEQQEPIRENIEKCEKKIAFAEKVITHLHNNSAAPDPRTEKVLAKIPGILKAHHPLKKIEKYMQRLNQINNSHCSLLEFQQKATAQVHLKDLWKELLQAKEQTKICNISDKDLYKYIPEHVEDFNLSNWLRNGKEQASASFLSSVFFTTPINHQFNNCCAEFIGQILVNGYEQPHHFDRINSPLAGICERNEHPHLCRMPFHENDTFDCFKPTHDEFYNRLDAISFVKKDRDLDTIAAVVSFGDRHLILTIDRENTLYLFNPYGDRASHHCPYITAFGNVDQVSAFLNNLSLENEGPTRLTAVCSREELVEACLRPHYEDSSEEENFHIPPAHGEDFPAQPPTLETAFFPVFVLQNVVRSLSLLNEDGFCAAIEGVEQLSQFHLQSPVNGERSIMGDRICFHVYHIQNKETPDVIDRSNTTWGTLAFQTDLSTPEQKLRAAQRAQVEVLLGTLCDYFEGMENNPITNAIPSLFFGSLEGLDLDPRDLPEGTKKLAHYLFEKLYNNYKVVWKQNKTEMVDPDDVCFNADFGRNALTGDARGKVLNAYKLQALREVAQSLKEVWGL